MQSAIYQGEVFHTRLQPTRHSFRYKIYLFWLKLNELSDIDGQVKHFSATGFAPVQFRRTDYLGDPSESLQQSVLNKISELNGTPVEGEIYMLGQMRGFGLYFSPVNFFFVRTPTGSYSHMLAEVSNTPWNEKHYYLVNLDQQSNTQKAFHVSPFNPMDMTYQWQIAQPGEQLSLVMHCVRASREFTAGLSMAKIPLNSRTLRRTLFRIPSMTIKTMAGIYWQALRLWLKGTPVYTHPLDSQEKK